MIMTSARRAGLCAPALAAGLLMPVAAYGYARQLTCRGTGTPLAWRSGCVFVTPDSEGARGLGYDATLREIQAAARSWIDATSSCSYMRFQFDPPIAPRHGGYDGINQVVLLKDFWGRIKSDGTRESYSNEAPGLTTLFFIDDPSRSDNGRIVDADTELNDVRFNFVVVNGAQCTPSPCPGCPGSMDLQNTLAHELGHMLGLDHPCFNAGDVGPGCPHPRDETGMDTPSCSSVPLLPPDQANKIRESTMYNFASCLETKKRSPEPDDVAGICATYPLAQDPRSCARAPRPGGDSGGCSAARGRPGLIGVPFILASVMLAVYLVGRRRAVRARSR